MASLDLRPIDDSNVDVATSILVRGFPERDDAFWRAGLQRILTMRDAARHPPIGYLMTVGNDDAGVVLTIPSQRPDATGMTDVIHLAAWYMDEPHRWLAARMMKKVVATANTVFFDLTPNPAAQVINRRLGFDLLDEGFLIYLLPLTAMRFGGSATVLSFEHAYDELTADDRHLLAQHRALGCIVGALRTGGQVSPLIFTPMQRRGVPGVRLIRAASKQLVTDNLGAISRFLLRQKVLFLRMDATRKDSAAGSFAARWTEPTFIKGPRGSAEVDLAYSEFVFLGTA
ncbi:hypothetical protein RPMA_06635 [Tardiphaga alba]|uniref:N-acetyltransferase domain-containing protein n=1 Tax=Tardiphaga alba TaxID=340268 RepID=A0ABX8A800_9BRAD|nr:hypothetical protein [Tardiphaga alba]QUS38545.1 hypothetical protein RPMA_06635 [Tardiphaga alba]